MINIQQIRKQIGVDLLKGYREYSNEKDINGMLSTLDRLVSYRLIKDLENSFMYKELKKKGVDIVLSRDPRKKVEYNSKWLFGESRDMMCTLVCTGHTGKRIEGSYEGEVRVKSREMPLIIREVKHSSRTHQLREQIESLKARNNFKGLVLPVEFEDRVKCGIHLVYEIEVERGNFLKNKFGYIIVSKDFNTNNFNAVICLDVNALKMCSVDIGKAKQVIRDTLIINLKSLNNNTDIRVEYLK